MTSTMQMNHPIEREIRASTFLDPRVYDELSALLDKVYCEDLSAPIRSLMLTSPQPRSGVSYLASCISTMLAERHGPTLLVDALAIVGLARKGRIPTRFMCTQINHGHLWVLGSAPVAEMSADSLVAPLSVREIIEKLELLFDYVMVDAPAMSISNAAEFLSTAVNGSMLVVTPNVTEVREVAQARSKLTKQGGRLVGAIYNRIDGNSGTGEML
ncbi:hypothetical protein BH10ACI4_BH10ACI4_11320 [soil metagenome]